MGDGVFIHLDNIPVPDLDKWATKCIRWPISLNPVILGLLQEIAYPDIWDGTDVEKSTMTAVLHTLMVDLMLGVECTSESGGNGNNGSDNQEYPLPGFEIFDTGECDVTNCSIPYGALRFNGGVLQYRYCGEWFDVEGAPTIPGQEDPSFEIPPDIDPEGEFLSACGKAHGMANIVWAVADFIWDTATIPSSGWFGELKNAFPAISFYEIAAYNAHLQALIMKGGITLATYGLLDFEKEDVLPSDLGDYIACQIVGQLDATPELDADYAWDLVESAFMQQAGINVFKRNFFGHVLSAIGKGDIATYGRLGAFDTTANCDCPGSHPFDFWSDQFDWVINWDFTQGSPYGIQLRVDNGISGITAAGLTMTTNTTGSETLGAWRTVANNTGFVENYYLEWYMGLPFIAADWGINGDIVGLAELKGYVVDDGGNSYHILRENAHRAVADISGSSFGLSSFQGSYDDTKNPKFPVVTRIVIAGNGAHPFGG